MPRTRKARLIDDLSRQIDDGTYPPGAQLPSERALAEEHGVSRGVARAALSALVTTGRVTGEPQVGYFVRRTALLDWAPSTFETHGTRRDTAEGGYDAWAAEVRAQGREPRQEVEVRVIRAPDFIAERLDLVDGHDVVVRLRDRYVDDERFQSADSYYPFDVARGTLIERPGDVFVPGGLMAHAGHGHAGVFEDEITARPPTPEEVGRLDIPTGTWVIQHIRTGRNEAGRRVRVIVTVMPADRHRIRYQVPAR